MSWKSWNDLVEGEAEKKALRRLHAFDKVEMGNSERYELCYYRYSEYGGSCTPLPVSSEGLARIEALITKEVNAENKRLAEVMLEHMVEAQTKLRESLNV